MSDLGTRLANSGQLLVYSGIEIDRVLSSMVDERSAISTNVSGEAMFLSRLLRADPVRQRLLIAHSDSKDANAEVLKMPAVSLHCHHRLGQFAFACRRPRPGDLGGQPAIKANSPVMLLAVQHNKKATRVPMPKTAPDLRCQLPADTLTLETRLVDLSLDGHAFILGDAGIPVAAGTWIRGARITPPGEQPVEVDVELKYVVPTVADGERATRIGCRIVGADDVMGKLVSLFIIDFH